MASIYLDKQSNNWKVKTLVNGKDSRPALRKASVGERESWDRGERQYPSDVMHAAGKHGIVFSRQKEEPKPDPDQIVGFIDWFLEDYATTRRPGTVVRMERLLRYFRTFLQTHYKPGLTVAEIDYDCMKAYFFWRLERRDSRLGITVKPHVGVAELTVMSGLFSTAITRKIIAINPLSALLKELRKAYPSPDPVDETKYLDPDQVRGFLAALDAGVESGLIPLDYADLARVMLATGLRLTAASSIEWSWITPDWTVKVPQLYDKAKYGYSAFIAKLGIDVLTRRRESGGTGRVFPNVSPGNSYYWLRRVCEQSKLDIDGTYNHMLRHSFATALVDASEPIQTIGDLLGQRCLQTTQRYAKVRDETKRNAVAKLNF